MTKKQLKLSFTVFNKENIADVVNTTNKISECLSIIKFTVKFCFETFGGYSKFSSLVLDIIPNILYKKLG